MEAEDTAADTSEILPPQGRQILAALPVLLADDPEFEMYNSSAFDQELLKATVSELRNIQPPTTPPRRVVAAEIARSVARSDQRGDTRKTAATAEEEETEDLGEISKTLYWGQFVTKKSNGRSPVMQRNPTLQPPAGAQKPTFQRKPAFPPLPIEMYSSSVQSGIPKGRPLPTIPLDKLDQPRYQRR